MRIKNYEFKARVPDLLSYEQRLLALHPEYKGLDHQIDTYFNVPKGRLKLREGHIENALIQYDRANVAGSKLSDVILYRHNPDPALKAILTQQFGVKVVVDKRRKIYFLGHVKFHFDEVAGLGTFLEVEAIDADGSSSVEALKQDCDRYFEFFGLRADDLVDCSYSDLYPK